MKELTRFLQEEGFYDMTIQEKDKLDSPVWVDFNNCDKLARVRLNCLGTINDLNWQGIHLIEDLKIGMYQDSRNTEIEGVVQYSEEEKIWVAKVDWLEVVEKNSRVISD